jgi:hypothetical protein
MRLQLQCRQRWGREYSSSAGVARPALLECRTCATRGQVLINGIIGMWESAPLGRKKATFR